MKHILTLALTLVMFQASAQKIKEIEIHESKNLRVYYTEVFGNPKVELKNDDGNSIYLDTARVRSFVSLLKQGYKKSSEWNDQAIKTGITEINKDLPQTFKTNGGWINDLGYKWTEENSTIKFTFGKYLAESFYMSLECFQMEGLYRNYWTANINSEEALNTYVTALDMDIITAKAREKKDMLNAFK